VIYVGIFSKLVASIKHLIGNKEMETTVPNTANQMDDWLWC